MTTKEAIRCIKIHNEIHSKSEPFAVYITEALAMSIEALEKQAPKKPIRANHGRIINGIPIMLDEDEFWKCPSCLYYDVMLKQNQSYCHKCGQAIDWSENNNV